MDDDPTMDNNLMDYDIDLPNLILMMIQICVMLLELMVIMVWYHNGQKKKE